MVSFKKFKELGFITESNDVSCNYYCIVFINVYIGIGSSILMNYYQWRACLPCNTPTKEPVELAVISDFYNRRPMED